MPAFLLIPVLFPEQTRGHREFSEQWWAGSCPDLSSRCCGKPAWWGRGSGREAGVLSGGLVVGVQWGFWQHFVPGG